jgi:hypothetical protein
MVAAPQLLMSKKSSQEAQEAPQSASKRIARVEDPEPNSFKDATTRSMDTHVVEWSQEAISSGVHGTEMPEEEVRRYIITSDNCSVKSAANEIVKVGTRSQYQLSFAQYGL